MPYTPTDRYDGLANDVTGLGDPEIDTKLNAHRTRSCSPRSVACYTDEWRQNWMANREISQTARDQYREHFRVEVEGAEVDRAEIKRLMEGGLVIGDDGSLTKVRGLEWWAQRNQEVGDMAGGSALFAIVEDGLDPAVPLDLRRVQRVVGWEVFDRGEITPYITDINVEPEYYYLTDIFRSGDESLQLQAGSVIHKSRLWLNPGRLLPRSVMRLQQWWGDSKLELAWPERRAAERGRDYLASYIQRTSWLHFQLGGLEEMRGQIDPETKEPIGPGVIRRVMAEQRKVLNTLGFLVSDGGRPNATSRDGGVVPGRNADKVESVVEPTGDLPSIIERMQRDWASARGMPPTIALGEATSALRGGDNASDWQSWGGEIKSEQGENAVPQLTWMLTIVFSASEGPTGGTVPDFTVEPIPLVQPTRSEDAEIAKAWSEIDVARRDAGLLTPFEIRQARNVEGNTDGPIKLESAEIGVNDGDGSSLDT